MDKIIIDKKKTKLQNWSEIEEDDIKEFYYRGLQEWKNEKGYLRDTCLTAQDRFRKYMDCFGIKCSE